MTIAQSTTIQAYQLRKGGTPARMAILRMIAADSANNRNESTRLQAGDWRRARNWTMKNYAAAYCSGINQGFDGESPIWCSHGGEQFRNERDTCEVLRMRHTGWYTDNYQDETAVGIVASLPVAVGYRGYDCSRYLRRSCAGLPCAQGLRLCEVGKPELWCFVLWSLS